MVKNYVVAVLAQLVERVAFNHVVVGSIPTDGLFVISCEKSNNFLRTATDHTNFFLALGTAKIFPLPGCIECVFRPNQIQIVGLMSPPLQYFIYSMNIMDTQSHTTT